MAEDNKETNKEGLEFKSKQELFDFILELQKGQQELRAIIDSYKPENKEEKEKKEEVEKEVTDEEIDEIEELLSDD